MRRFLKLRVIGFLAIAVVIAAVTLISVNTRGNSGFITNSLMSLSKPLKSAAASVAKTFESIYGYMHEYEVLEAENEKLKSELYKLKQDNQNSEEISKENDQLRSLLDLSLRHPDYTQYDTAEVISWSASNWDSSFTIGKGSSNSKIIKTGDCVITQTGALIGVVSEVEANSSTVITVLDTKFSYGAYIERNDKRALAKGDFTLMKQGFLKLDYLQDNEIVTGDTIITSGKGGILPAGLVIGTVQEVLTYNTGISRYATIKPTADLTSLANVYLITGFTQAGSGE